MSKVNKVHTINYSLNEAVTTDPDWDGTLTIGWPRFKELLFRKGMMIGDGIVINGIDGIYIGEISDIGDAEEGENYIVVDLM